MFESALIGLSKGVMEYENDPILPIVNNYIKVNTAKYSNISADEYIFYQKVWFLTRQRKLVSLTESQISTLKDLDKK